MKLEEQLRTLRQEKGLSQAELAELMDVSRQAVSRWETGVVVPATENLVRLSKLYDVPLDEMVHGAATPAEEGEPPAPEPAALEPPTGAKPKQGRRMMVWLAVLLCLLALAAGICIGYIAALKEEDNEILLMEDMKGEEVEEEARNTFATESLEEGKVKICG